MSKPRQKPATKSKRRDDDPVRVLDDGRVVYYPSGEVGKGPRKYQRCGTIDAAEVFAAELREQFDRYRVHGPLGAMPLHHVMATMIRHLKAIDAPQGSVKKYRSNWNKWIQDDDIRETACADLSIAHWTQVFDHLNEAKAGPSVVKSVGTTLGTLLEFGINRGYFTEDTFGSPARRSKVRKNAHDIAVTARLSQAALECGVTPEELTASRIELEHCPEWTDVEKYAVAFEALYPGYGYRFVLMAYATGMREGELAALRTHHIVRTAGLTKIRVIEQLDRYKPWPATKLPKNKKHRTTIVWEAFADVLDSLIEEAEAREGRYRGYLFPPMTENSWLDAVTHMGTEAKEASEWRWTFHWCRHAFASLSMAPESTGGFGIDVTVVSQWLGHAKPSTTLDMYLVKTKNADDVAKKQTSRHPRNAG